MASALETLCGQAFGAKQYHMLGIYLQRSWIVLFLFSVLLLPMFVFASPILKLLGQSNALAEQSGVVALWLIPMHLSFPFQFTLQRFLQSQLKTAVIAWISVGALAVHVFVSWFFVYKLGVGIVGAALTLDFSWWLSVFGLYGYAVFGGCPHSWTGFSAQAFAGLWEFSKLSVASGVMLAYVFPLSLSLSLSLSYAGYHFECVWVCRLENFYYRVLIIVSGYLNKTEVAVDALSIWLVPNSYTVCLELLLCILFAPFRFVVFLNFSLFGSMTIFGWESMIPLGFLAATGYVTGCKSLFPFLQ
jgi:MATE family multidrug resistance protein